jgi:hypothetical protein
MKSRSERSGKTIVKKNLSFLRTQESALFTYQGHTLMKQLNKNICRLALLACILIPGYSAAQEDKPALIEMKGKVAEVTFLEGRANRSRRDNTQSRSLTRGDFLFPGDRISIGKKSRIEIRLPDRTYIRCDEQTTLVLHILDCNKEKEQRMVRIKVLLGKIWSYVSKYTGIESRFEIYSKTATTGVRGTVYRMNIYADDSATIKVYSGEVQVSAADKSDSPAQAGKMTASPKIAVPHPVGGPRPVKGPHAVSVEEWTYILKSMQQIDIRPDGTAANPFSFLPENDLDEWVRWNKARDEKIRQ